MYFFDAHSDMLADAIIKRERGLSGNIARDHLPRLKRANIKGLIAVLWITVDWTHAPKARFPELLPMALAELEECRGEIRLARDMEDVEKAENDDVPYMILGVEGASGFVNGLDTIRDLYDKGVRHIGLSWNEQNEFATGAGSTKAERGLTRLGRDAVALMEELGILVDLSHLNEKSFWDALDASKGVVMASHSNCRLLCPVERNLTDQQIRAIGRRGGVIGMNAWGAFVKNGTATVEDMIDHVDHIVKLAGIETVACGFDFCDYFGTDPTSEQEKAIPVTHGLASCEDTPVFRQQLEKRGYSNDDIEKIAFRNMRRVLKAVL